MIRHPENWKIAQTTSALQPVTVAQGPSKVSQEEEEEKKELNENRAEHKSKRKRKREEQKDEIDQLFEGVKENRFSKVNSNQPVTKDLTNDTNMDQELEQVLRAIKIAPKNEGNKRRKP